MDRQTDIPQLILHISFSTEKLLTGGLYDLWMLRLTDILQFPTKQLSANMAQKACFKRTVIF